MDMDAAGAIAKIQADTMRVLSTLLPHGSTVALVDFPNHQNAGDSLIWRGTRKYLAELGVSVDYMADMSRYSPDDLTRLVPAGPILIQGGGNFGDRWDAMQALRERVIADFPDRQIIQLPQGVDFSEGPKLARAQAVLGAHPDLTLLIRDHEGVTRTEELFPSARVLFCPDLAFGNGLMHDPHERERDVVVLLRQDAESVAPDVQVPTLMTRKSVEWGLSGLRLLRWKVLHIPGAVAKRSSFLGRVLYPVVANCYDRQAELNVSTAIKTLANGRLVLTDRLHAAVLGALLRKPVIALDNANGKVGAIHRDYLGTMPNVKFARTADAVEDELSFYFQ